jgi:hypothetical protein
MVLTQKLSEGLRAPSKCRSSEGRYEPSAMLRTHDSVLICAPDTFLVLSIPCLYTDILLCRAYVMEELQ